MGRFGSTNFCGTQIIRCAVRFSEPRFARDDTRVQRVGQCAKEITGLRVNPLLLFPTPARINDQAIGVSNGRDVNAVANAHLGTFRVFSLWKRSRTRPRQAEARRYVMRARQVFSSPLPPFPLADGAAGEFAPRG